MGKILACIRTGARLARSCAIRLRSSANSLENRVDNYLERLLELAHLCLIALLAACAKISYQTLNGTPFKFSMFLALFMVAIFAAFLAGSVTPITFEYRDGVIGIAAWSGSELVRAIEARLLARVSRELDQKP